MAIDGNLTPRTQQNRVKMLDMFANEDGGSGALAQTCGRCDQWIDDGGDKIYCRKLSQWRTDAGQMKRMFRTMCKGKLGSYTQ